MKIKVNKVKLAYIFLVLPFLKPASFVNNYFLDILFDVWRILSVLLALLVFFIDMFSKEKKEIFTASNMLRIYVIYMLAVTIYNNSSIKQWGLICLLPVVFMFWLEKWMKIQYFDCIRFLYWMYCFLSLINLITLILYPNTGLYIDQYGGSIYFLGMRTRWSDVFFPLFSLMLIVNRYKIDKTLEKYKKYAAYVFITIMIFYQIIYKWIAAAILGFVIFFAIAIINKIAKKNIKLVYILGAAILFNISIIFFRLQNIFEWLLTTVLKKDVGMNSRIMIFDSAISVIKEQWLLGAGITETTNFVPLYEGSLIAQAHSLILQLWHDGGLIGLIIFMTALFVFCLRNNVSEDIDTYLCGLIVVISVILGVAEIYFYHIYIFAMLAIGSHNTKKGRQVFI